MLLCFCHAATRISHNCIYPFPFKPPSPLPIPLLRVIIELQLGSLCYTATDAKSLQSCPTLCDPIDGSLSGNVWWEDSYVLSLMSPLSLFKWNSTLLPGTEVIVWGRLGSPLVNILFRTKLISLVPLSWDMDCLLTLWLTLPLVPLVTVAIRLISDLYHSRKKFLVPQPIYSHRKIIKAPLLHQSLGPWVSLSLSLSLFYFLIIDSVPPGSGPLKDPNKWRQGTGTLVYMAYGAGWLRDLLRSVYGSNGWPAPLFFYFTSPFV